MTPVSETVTLIVSASLMTGSPSSDAVMTTPLAVAEVPAGGESTRDPVPLPLSVNVAHDGRLDADSVMASPSGSLAETGTVSVVPDVTVLLPTGASTGATFAASPLPARLIGRGLFVPVWRTLSVPLAEPPAVGVKRTVSVRLAPGARVTSPASLKSSLNAAAPAMSVDWIVTELPPGAVGLVRVTVAWSKLPTSMLPNASEPADACTATGSATGWSMTWNVTSRATPAVPPALSAE